MKRKPFWKYVLFFLGALILFAAMVSALGFVKFTQIEALIAKAKSGAFAPPPTAVTTEVAKRTQWRPTLESVGTVMAVNGVTVSTDLAGIVRDIAFDSGNKVRAGDLLVHLDTTQEEAQLHQAESDRDLAAITLKRDKDLLEKHAIAQSDYDNAQSAFLRTQAAVDQFNALIARKTLRAPFDGVVGIRQVNLGQYLKEGDPVVTLQAFDPIYVNFSLPQQDLAKISVGEPVALKVDAFGDRAFHGKITAINSLVDQATRNVQIQATLPNPDWQLRPGMFAKVSVLMSNMQNVIAVPATAIHYAPYGDSIFVISQLKDQTGKAYRGVREQFIKLGQSRGDMIAVTSGLEPGDEVVTSGVFRLRNGMPVIVNNKIKPDEELAPNPADS
ncbi:MAG TPA: efflux RND transporter periplasmic adaptor subunit [Chthoniobacterales bacterium]|nr:efflux RND transporter periplasmic adaptor subunit [Chthoniobacterales bacterium]